MRVVQRHEAPCMSTLTSWLLMPLSGALENNIQPWAYWHARCMVLGWGILIPVGVLLTRYFKITSEQKWPSELDNKVWWHGHLALQWLAMLTVSLGVVLAWGHSQYDSDASRLHAWGGWTLLAIGWGQIASGLSRGSKGGPTDPLLRGDHYDMTRRRIWFERIHKFLGWLAVLMAIVLILMGLSVVDAPRWMPVILILWWLALGFAAWFWQKQGRCTDTYQAIWGPDPQHPGNALPPIGWGVRRRKNRQQHG